VAQRMFSARDERHSVWATLWFNVAHYALRPWPWILAALVSLILFPGLKDPETGYIHVMIACLPPALRGLMVAAFAAAFMSTIGTQLNWGASYLINDFYRRFVKREASQRHYVLASQLATVLLAVASAVVTFYLESIAGAWKLLIVTGAGTGTVLILRWFWWRINAWSEVSAMAAAFAVSLYLQLGLHWDSDDPIGFAHIMLITVGATTLVWLVVTLLTGPEPEEKLIEFYRRARPGPALWGSIPAKAGGPPSTDNLSRNFFNWAAGCILIYASLFGIGKVVLLEWREGALFLAIAVAAAFFLARPAVGAERV
jgi:SSS family solute:Na+ symporter